MSFVKIGKTFFERTSVTLRPEVKFISSSLGLGVTGSEYVSPVRSKCIKSIVNPNSFTLNSTEALLITASVGYDSSDYNVLSSIKAASEIVTRNITNGVKTEGLDAYLTA